MKQIDITNDVCPMTFVRTKLAIESLEKGDSIEIRLKGREPLENVPRSVLEMGWTILSFDPEVGEQKDGIHRLLVKKT
ncbi:MAG: sulfurtransferase TusA family protein [Rhodospirillaceae bacterium]